MPRVHFVEKARKPIPHAGVEVGDSYYWWKFRYGGRRVSKTRPRRSQLTQSLWSSVYAAQEELADSTDMTAIAELARQVVVEAEQVMEEYETAAEAFNNSGLNQERYEAAENFVNEAETFAESIESYMEDLKELEWKGETVWYDENNEQLLSSEEVAENLSEWADELVALELEV
jgi:hypothetical protein